MADRRLTDVSFRRVAEKFRRAATYVAREGTTSLLVFIDRCSLTRRRRICDRAFRRPQSLD